MVMPKQAGAITRYDNRPIEDDQTRLAVLDALLAGKTPKTVALDVGYHPAQVQKVAGFHGWPNVTYLQRARDTLADRLAHPEKYEPQKGAAEPAARADTKVTQPAAAKQRAPQAPAAAQVQVVMTAEHARTPEARARLASVVNPRPSSTGSLSDLVERGRSSKRPSTRHLAESLVLAVRALSSALIEDRSPNERVAAATVTAEQPAEPERKKRKAPTGPTAYDRQKSRLAALGLTADEAKTWGEERGYPSSKAPMLRAGLLDALEASR